MGISALFERCMRKWKTGIAVLLLGMVTSLGIAFFMTPKYETSFELLVTQQQESGMDLYTAAKTTEYISTVLSEVLESRNFLDRVIQANASIDQNYFKQDAQELKKQWERMVSSHVRSSSGVIEISVLHPNKTQSFYVAHGMVNVLLNSGPVYIGGSFADIQLIDAPLTGKYAASPNIGLFLAMGAVSGVLIWMVVNYLFLPTHKLTSTLQDEASVMEHNFLT